jgi:hypothetical protein
LEGVDFHSVVNREEEKNTPLDVSPGELGAITIVLDEGTGVGGGHQVWVMEYPHGFYLRQWGWGWDMSHAWDRGVPRHAQKSACSPSILVETDKVNRGEEETYLLKSPSLGWSSWGTWSLNSGSPVGW